MYTPWNSFFACLLAKNDRIGRARLDLVNGGHVILLGLSAPCSMHHACRSTGSFPVKFGDYSTGELIP